MLLQLDPQDLRLVRRKQVRRNAEISGKNLALTGVILLSRSVLGNQWRSPSWAA
jgi:hypothetical protein